MKKKKYVKPICILISLGNDLMETLPIGKSGTTDSGDDSGGGLAKRGFGDSEGNNDDSFKNYNLWDDE